MHVSDWTPPETPEQGNAQIDGEGGDGNAFRPLMALVAAVFIAVATMFTCDYASSHSACTVHVTAQQC